MPKAGNTIKGMVIMVKCMMVLAGSIQIWGSIKTVGIGMISSRTRSRLKAIMVMRADGLRQKIREVQAEQLETKEEISIRTNIPKIKNSTIMVEIDIQIRMLATIQIMSQISTCRCHFIRHKARMLTRALATLTTSTLGNLRCMAGKITSTNLDMMSTSRTLAIAHHPHLTSPSMDEIRPLEVDQEAAEAVPAISMDYKCTISRITA